MTVTMEKVREGESVVALHYTTRDQVFFFVVWISLSIVRRPPK